MRLALARVDDVAIKSVCFDHLCQHPTQSNLQYFQQSTKKCHRECQRSQLIYSAIEGLVVYGTGDWPEADDGPVVESHFTISHVKSTKAILLSSLPPAILHPQIPGSARAAHLRAKTSIHGIWAHVDAPCRTNPMLTML